MGCKFPCTYSLCSFKSDDTEIINRSIIYTASSSMECGVMFLSILRLLFPSGPWRRLIVLSAHPTPTSSPSFTRNHIWPVSPISRGFRHRDDKSSPLRPEAPKSLKPCLECALKRTRSEAKLFPFIEEQLCHDRH